MLLAPVRKEKLYNHFNNDFLRDIYISMIHNQVFNDVGSLNMKAQTGGSTIIYPFWNPSGG